ncbi:MAG: hypothetical protein ACTSSK_13640 [Candidatus Heimdallarchaeota archaeon]
MSDNIICPYCHSSVKQREAYCLSCGAEITVEEKIYESTSSLLLDTNTMEKPDSIPHQKTDKILTLQQLPNKSAFVTEKTIPPYNVPAMGSLVCIGIAVGVFFIKIIGFFLSPAFVIIGVILAVKGLQIPKHRFIAKIAIVISVLAALTFFGFIIYLIYDIATTEW